MLTLTGNRSFVSIAYATAEGFKPDRILAELPSALPAVSNRRILVPDWPAEPALFGAFRLRRRCMDGEGTVEGEIEDEEGIGIGLGWDWDGRATRTSLCSPSTPAISGPSSIMF